MTLGIITRDITDESGNLLEGALVTVRQGHSSGGALAQVYSDASGSTPLSNPVSVPTGTLTVYVMPGRYRLEGTSTAGAGVSLVDTSIVAGGLGGQARNNTQNDARFARRSNNLSDLSNASTARTNLGLGSIATQAANNVSITGGSGSFSSLAATSDANIHNIIVGRGGGGITTSTAIGRDALGNNTTGGSNTAVGRAALGNNTTGDSNTAVGRDALSENTEGNENTAVGRRAMLNNTTGSENTAVGRDAMLNNTTGSDNTAIGRDAMLNNTTGTLNTAVGLSALRSNTMGNENTAVGLDALSENTEGIQNTAVGRSALLNNTTGDNNVAVGRAALFNNTTGTLNTAVGHNALFFNTTGLLNTAVGRNTLFNNTTGDNNTAIGRDALSGNTTGIQNIAIGRDALGENTTGDNNIGIGLSAGRATSPFEITNQNNRIVMGNNDHTNAYINISWTVTSDARDKDNFAPVPHGLDFVNALQPTEYQLKAGGRDGSGDGKRRYGFLAQDILGAEGENPVIVDAEDPEKLKLHESYIVPVLVNAIKELTAQVEGLQSEVNALKGK